MSVPTETHRCPHCDRPDRKKRNIFQTPDKDCHHCLDSGGDVDAPGWMLVQLETGELMAREKAYKWCVENKMGWIFNAPGDEDDEDYDCLAANPECDECGIKMSEDDMNAWLSDDWEPHKRCLCEACSDEDSSDEDTA